MRKYEWKLPIFSLPHSGTTFCLNYLLADPVLHAESFMMYHVNSVIRVVDSMDESMAVVMPVRHPFRIMRSWVSRGRPPAEKKHSNFIYQFDEFFRVAEIAKERGSGPYHIPIDCPDIRDGYRDKLAERLGADLPTDWPKKNAIESESQYIDIPHESMELVEEVLDKYSNFFCQFGYTLEMAA